MENNKLFESFDPDGPAQPDKLFGLPFSPENAEVLIIPVPWEATVSYGKGTARAPAVILKASAQVDLMLPGIVDAWKLGISMLPIQNSILEESDHYREMVENYFSLLENESDEPDKNVAKVPKEVDKAAKRLNGMVKSMALKHLDDGKIVAVVGGDHSTSLGLIQALNSREDGFGILQIDAHADLRNSYQDFTYSHACIMHHALENKNVSNLVQVGVRDLGEQEWGMIQSDNRISCYLAAQIMERIFKGENWFSICDEIIAELPEKVYISFDIDGLDPKLCPGTGTPVPGGLDFPMVLTLLKMIALQKEIIGFDLCEVGVSAWDGNVAARILYYLSCFTGVSQGLLKVESF